MATLQKFKFLATQCAIAGSPSRSPTTSPVIHLRRRRTLRMLLGRVGGGGAGAGRRLPQRHDDGSSDRSGGSDKGGSPENRKELSVSHKLRDLFVSSPPAFGDRVSEDMREGFLLPPSGAMRRGGGRFLRPLSSTIRQRLLRRAWRPVLVAIPE